MRPRRPTVLALVLVAGVLAAPGAGAQAPRNADTSGFVIRDPLILRRCATCHKADSAGRLGRISFMRKTPEGWEASIRRMASLVRVRLDPADARAIVKYLANTQGLAPAEVRPGRFETERRSIDYRYTADANTERTCRACHSLGRVITQRRTRTEWELLVATHRGYYPNSDFQAFRRAAPSPADSAPQPHPMDQAIAHLSRAFPLRTTEWNAWSATMRPAPLEGTWLLTGYEAGKGPFHGRLVATRVPGTDDEFTTRATYRYAAGGPVITRDGKSVVYTGHQWRGRSSVTGTPSDSSWREVLSVEPGWQEVTGRWFRGGYDEFGMDVTLRRAGTGTQVTGVWPRGVRVGERGVDVTVYGSNLPRAATPGAIDFGPGVAVERVVRGTGDELVVRVSVDSTATVGARDLFVGGASLRQALVAWRTIDRIRVTPASGMARIGGVRFPKQFSRFEAVGYLNGPDGKPETDDDIEVGAVPVSWGLEEYGVTFKDDDTKFVGTIDGTGLFTPAVDGPNAQRSRNRNNIGDVWVVATYTPATAGARALKGRALLIVTVPLYMRWEPARTAP
ncbi:MAG: quinohemoprotein amine dehydrogenase subunit alpha [Gemmatimonadaceae bacterium]|nr:quinohemoprotein amine dehydrogenase subunit alpha [Gemmatimonadaceae bacterium]